MENRLPFDELPETKRSSQKLHRIARCDWRWVKWADAADMKWDPRRGEAWEGARRVVEALLTKKRSRWGLDKVSETEWVGEGILLLDAPLRRIDDDDDDDDDDDG